MPRLHPKLVAAHLGNKLRQQYHIRSCRPIKGDTVRVMKGEYSGIEGKVDSANTTTGTLEIEGIQREKVRGGNVKVKIHSSNVLITNLNLDDKYRQQRLQRQSPEKSRRRRKAKIHNNRAIEERSK